MKKKHIVFVLGDYPIVNGKQIVCGGIAVITRKLALGLIEKGFDVSVIGMIGSINSDSTFVDNGINVFLFRNLDYYDASLFIEKKLKEINDFKPIDLVEITDSRPIISKFLPYPTCLRLHNSLSLAKFNSGIISSEQDLSNKNELYYFYSLNLVDSIVGVSDTIIKETVDFHGISPNLIYGSIYNGVSIEPIITHNSVSTLDKKVNIFCHGTLGRMKGQVALCKAFKELYDLDNNKYTLTLIGRGEQYFIKECLPVLGASAKNVKYISKLSQSDLMKECSKLDVYVSLSKTESFGLATIEAMSLGKPVIVNDIPINRELFEDGKDAILVKAESASMVAKKIIDLTQDNELYASYSRNAVITAQKFTAESTIDESIKWYDYVIGNKTKLLNSRNMAFEKIMQHTFFENDVKLNIKTNKLNKRVLFIDNIHLSNNSFPELHTYLKQNKLDQEVLEDYKDLKLLRGDYVGQHHIKEHLYLINLNFENLAQDFTYKGYKLFDLCYDEMLSYVLADLDFHSELLKSDDVFTILKENYTDILKSNLANTLFWINYFSDNIIKIDKCSHAIVFSGSTTYQKVFFRFVELNKINIRVFCSENFFTGKDFYMEERLSPIPNNSLIKGTALKTVNESRKALILDKVRYQNNLNTQQPRREFKKVFPQSDKKTLLILGQVINDYSITTQDRVYKSNLNFYKELIEKTLENTDLNIIIKTHPYESKKLALGKNLTFDYLTECFKENNRVKIVDVYNIYSLFEQSDYLATICSQSALEAAFYGKKVTTFGDAFFSNKGFTYDFKYIDHYIDSLKNDDIRTNLTVTENANYVNFLLNIFEFNLASDINSDLLSKYFGTNLGLDLLKISYSDNNDFDNLSVSSAAIQQLRAKESRLNAIENSTSWKLTKGLRNFGNLLIKLGLKK